MKFGENLKEIRKKHKMSQEALAEKMSVTRQSVSKWENGESYPEMNKILKLCEIFNCQLNDLVHAEITDLNFLDDNIVKKTGKFNVKKREEMNALCNIISLIGKIGAIVLKVAFPFIVLIMILIPIIISNIEINNNEISFSNNYLEIVDGNKLIINDVQVGKIDSDIEKLEIINLLEENSKVKITVYLEVGLIFLLIELVLMIFVFSYIEKLFNNIKINQTPFILDNITLIKRIAYILIALIFIMPLSSLPINILMDINVGDSTFELINILEVLIILSMSYIFEYGYELQNGAKINQDT